MTQVYEDAITKDLAVKSYGEVVIDIKNLEKGFGNHQVLKSVNLKLYKGENLVVLGKSGTGKSVLINL